MKTILIRYAEIGLKGKNRSFFEKKLTHHISQTLNIPPQKIIKQNKQFLLNLDSQTDFNKLKKVFGIAWFASIKTCPSQLKAITALAKTVKTCLKPRQSFAVKAHRADKTLPFTSQQIAEKAGQIIQKTTKAKVNLNHPDKIIYICVNFNQTYLYTQKIPGPGGLPVGTSGKMLSLLSGGFDSLLSSYLMAKRGAQIDFLHFHAFTDYQKVLNSKILELAKKLSSYTLSSNLYLTPYRPFHLAVLNLKPHLQKQKTIVFRRFMGLIAQKLAQKKDYQALVLGDSLGQVASQTLPNLLAVNQAVDLPIFRPLIGLDKKDIIDSVKNIKLYQTALKPYKDCCSLVSSQLTTRADLAKIKAIEDQIKLSQIVSQTVSQIKLIKL